MTVTVPLGFRISWYSASPFRRVSQDTTLGGFPLAEVQVATSTLSSCPFLARSTAWVPSTQLVGLAAGKRRAPWDQLSHLDRAVRAQDTPPPQPSSPLGCAVPDPSQHFSRGLLHV